VSKYPHLCDGFSGRYRAKVKLHGTNAGIQITPNGNVVAMSRTALITVQNDNAGFAKWVAEREAAFKEFIADDGRTVCIYGEWCGPGIQKGVAINKIPNKIFAVFAMYIAGNDLHQEFIDEPVALNLLERIPGVHIIPWFNSGETFNFDLHATTETLQPELDKVNKYVVALEACDPWVKSTFGFEGTGEGLVFYPEHASYKSFSDLAFKAKGEKHQVVAHTKPVQADPTIANNLESFANLVITVARLEQGVRAINNGELLFDPKKIGAFLEWISKDVIKETQAEIAVANLVEKDAVKACNNKARAWYIAEMKKL
jgi:hypothetical protein